MNHPQVSIIIPAYNNADYTAEAVESVLAQTCKEFEVIVVDDGSTDHTREALDPYRDRIDYVYKQNGGACSARNLGISRARGEYIACLDCDDLWLPEKLDHSLRVLESDPKIGFVFTACYTIDGAGKITGKVGYVPDLKLAYQELLMGNYIPAPTVVMRRSCLEQVGLFDESIFIPADWDLWLRLAYQFCVGYVDQPLSKYRLTSSYAVKNVDQFVRESNYVLEKQFCQVRDLPLWMRDLSRQRLFITQGFLYSQASERRQAIRLMGSAIGQYPLSWRLYGHFALSLLGCTAWKAGIKIWERYKTWG